VAAYLYVILPDEQNKIPKPIVGPLPTSSCSCPAHQPGSRGRVK